MKNHKKVNGSLALKSPRTVVIPANTPEQTRKLRVAAYARVSSNSEDQLNSFAAQNAHYTELITSNPDWEFVDVYADKGITGTSAEKREDFQRLLADCRRGRIDRILVKSSSRFARNAKECLEAVRELKALDVSVCFEEQNIDTAELSGELLTAIFAMMDQKESETISQNMRWSFQTRMKRGTYVPTYLPFGYELKDGTIQILPEKAEIIQRIFREYLSGYNVEEIAKGLCKDNIPCKNGKVAWSSTGIRYIITNEKYMGDSHWQKYYTADAFHHKSKLNRGERESYYAKKTHKGIISKDTFAAANALMRQRAQAITTSSDDTSPLKKHIICGGCGSVFRRKAVRKKIYWVCMGREKKQTKDCAITQIPEHEIEGAFLRVYHKLQRGKSILVQMAANLQTARNGKMLWSASIVELNNQIADITRQDRLLTQLKHQGLVDPDIFISRRDALAEQLRAVKLEKERLLESEENPTIAQTRVLLETLEAAPEFLDTFDEELFREIVDKIIVESNERLRFRLINGLELTEDIERTVR